MKEKRQKMICTLIRKNNVETQSQLAELLGKSGFSVTQTTVSRDIKELKLIKVLADDGISYKYTLPEQSVINEKKYTEIFERQVIKAFCTDTMVVVRTHAGAAALVGQAVDALDDDTIFGTIAGYDTVFISTKSTEAAKRLYDIIKKTSK